MRLFQHSQLGGIFFSNTAAINIPWHNAFWPGLTPFGQPMWQAEADTEMTLSASPTTAAGQKALALPGQKALFHGTSASFWLKRNSKKY